jgi:hypothetical protein
MLISIYMLICHPLATMQQDNPKKIYHANTWTRPTAVGMSISTAVVCHSETPV